ncbi:MAG: hypothetical protein IPO15_26375 [Anaerolineae bacterium]|uniref:hypothetical protein n=1 Tax=Candidatus Amarolinea dominans TaxID=3140696 RepID=UPI0031362422|nr:hypothetical protein [Anaerolineae bacterium]
MSAVAASISAAAADGLAAHHPPGSEVTCTLAGQAWTAHNGSTPTTAPASCATRAKGRRP